MTLCICNQAKACTVKECKHYEKHKRIGACSWEFKCGPWGRLAKCEDVEEEE